MSEELPEVKCDAFSKSKHGEGKSLLKNFLLYLSVHWGDLIEQIKKICHIHFDQKRRSCEFYVQLERTAQVISKLGKLYRVRG